MNRTLLLAAAAMVLASCWAALAAEPSSPAKPAADAGPIAGLIKQLGSDDPTLREEATDALTKLGLSAFSALDAVSAHPDLEVRFRAQRILGLIREQDLQRRLDAFLSNKEDARDYPLPGWKRFQKSYGDDTASRKLFVDLQRADPELLAAIEESPRKAADTLGVRTLQHQQSMQAGLQQLSLGQIVVMLFITAEEDVTLQAQTMSLVFNYCNQQSLREALENNARKEIPRKMVGTIIRRSEDLSAYQAMILAANYKLPEGLIPAQRILSGGARVPHMSQYALLTVAKLGDESHLPMVEKLLDDKSVVTRMQENNKVWDVQVRDAAVATAILISKQELATYFTGRPQQNITDYQQIFFNPRLIGFQNEADREAVQKKWAVWRAEHPLPEAKNAEAKPDADKPAK